MAQGIRCATVRSPSGQPNLAGFCRDSGGIRDNPSNSGSYTHPAPRVHHITNVNDDGSVPQTAKWNQNFLSPALNNFRQNEQGDIPPTALSDVTSDEVTCMTMGNASVLSAEVCNRGVKTVGAGLKTAFYQGDPADGQVLCVATTMDALEVEQCVVVSCQVNAAVMGEVNVVGNDDGMGGNTTLECTYTNDHAPAAPIECK